MAAAAFALVIGFSRGIHRELSAFYRAVKRRRRLFLRLLLRRLLHLLLRDLLSGLLFRNFWHEK